MLFSVSLIAAGLATMVSAVATVEEPELTVTTILVHLALIAVALLFGVLAVLAPGLIRKARDWFALRTEFEIPAVAMEQADALAQKAIAYAEEQCRKALKQGLDGTDKQPAAIDFFDRFASAYGLEAWGREKIAQYLEAKLHLERVREGMP